MSVLNYNCTIDWKGFIIHTLNTKQAKFCQKEAYSLAFLASMLNGGPGGPRDFGKMSTHI